MYRLKTAYVKPYPPQLYNLGLLVLTSSFYRHSPTAFDNELKCQMDFFYNLKILFNASIADINHPLLFKINNYFFWIIQNIELIIEGSYRAKK
jgi:hypothetical protein